MNESLLENKLKDIIRRLEIVEAASAFQSIRNSAYEKFVKKEDLETINKEINNKLEQWLKDKGSTLDDEFELVGFLRKIDSLLTSMTFLQNFSVSDFNMITVIVKILIDKKIVTEDEFAGLLQQMANVSMRNMMIASGPSREYH